MLVGACVATDSNLVTVDPGGNKIKDRAVRLAVRKNLKETRLL